MSRRRWLLLLAVLALAGAALLLASRPRERPLLERATRVSSARVAASRYEWLTPRTILVGHGQSNVGIQDIQTGKVTALSRVSAILQQEEDPPYWQLSPDKKRLLWYAASSKVSEWQTAALDGSGLIRIPVPDSVINRYLMPSIQSDLWCWMPDSREWVWLVDDIYAGQKRALIYRMDPPGIQSTVAVTFQQVPGYVADVSLLGVSSNMDVLIRGLILGRDTETSDLLAFSLSSRTSTAVRLSRQMDINSRIVHAELSPNGNDILFLTRNQKPVARITRWMRRLLSRPDYPYEEKETLWVCRNDGRGLREIGSHFLGSAHSANILNEPIFYRWMPDGRRISFLYRGALWTVPAE